jgi:hypothetical protein
MKIRIKGNSIRIRLSKSEVALFAAKGCVEERTDFGDNALVYAIKTTRDETMSATFAGGVITMFVPEDLLQQWSSSDLVSLEHNMPLEENSSLHILLEKDFKCIDADVTEDQSDYFENPLKSC